VRLKYLSEQDGWAAHGSKPSEGEMKADEAEHRQVKSVPAPGAFIRPVANPCGPIALGCH